MPKHIFDFATQLDYVLYLLILVGVLLACFILFRGLAFYKYDPIWLMVLAIVFGLGNMLYVSYQKHPIADWVVPYLIFGICAFALGAHIAHWPLRQLYLRRLSRQTKSEQKMQRLSILSTSLATRILLISTCLLVLAITIRAATLGLPIFAEDPEAQKTIVNAGGFGVLQRIIGPCVELNLMLSFYLWHAAPKVRRKLLIHFLVALFAILVSGSKGAVVSIYQTFFLANAYLALCKNQRHSVVSLRIILIAAGGILGYALLVLILRATGTQVDNTQNFVINTLLARFIAYGDGIYYYFLSGELYDKLRYVPRDYFQQYVVIPLLAPLRLVSYGDFTLGTEIIYYMFGAKTTTGPNPTMTVEGYVFFGAVGGVVYCFLLGVLFSILRFGTLNVRTSRKVVGMLVFGFGNLISLKITADMLLVMGSVFDYLTTLVMIALIASAMLLFDFIHLKHTKSSVMDQPYSDTEIRTV